MYLPALGRPPRRRHHGRLCGATRIAPWRSPPAGASSEVHTDWRGHARLRHGRRRDRRVAQRHAPRDGAWRRPTGASTSCARSRWRSTPTQAREMVDAAAAAGLMTMVPFTYRWMPTNQWIKALVEDGYVGRPYHLNLRYFTGYARSDRLLVALRRRAVGRGVARRPGLATGCTWPGGGWARCHAARRRLRDLLRARTAGRMAARTRQGEDSALDHRALRLGRHRIAPGVGRVLGGHAVRADPPRRDPRQRRHALRDQRLGHRPGGAWRALRRATAARRSLPVPDELWQGARRSSGPRHLSGRVPRGRRDGAGVGRRGRRRTSVPTRPRRRRPGPAAARGCDARVPRERRGLVDVDP